MSKQIAFFMTFADELAFLSEAQRDLGPWLIVFNTSRTARELVTELKPVDASSENLSFVRVDDLKDITSKYVAEQRVFCIDLLNSNIVQFNRCIMMNGWLASGRLWYERKTDFGLKCDDYLAWANKLFVWIKKHYERADDGLHFVGPDAKIRAADGSLKLGPPREGISHEQAKKILG